MNRTAALFLSALITLTAACAASTEPTDTNEGKDPSPADAKNAPAAQGDVPVVHTDGTVTTQRMSNTWKCCRISSDGSMTCSSTGCP